MGQGWVSEAVEVTGASRGAPQHYAGRAFGAGSGFYCFAGILGITGDDCNGECWVNFNNRDLSWQFNKYLSLIPDDPENPEDP